LTPHQRIHQGKANKSASHNLLLNSSVPQDENDIKRIQHAIDHPTRENLNPHVVMQLQRLYGNAYVSKLHTQALARTDLPAQPTISSIPIRPIHVMRSQTRSVPLDKKDPQGEAGKGPVRKIKSTSDVATWLQVGQRAIELIKEKYLLFGSGNIVESWVGSEGKALNRLNAFRDMYHITDEGKPEMDTDKKGIGTLGIGQIPTTGANEILKIAYTSASVQGGNCLQTAAVAYALLSYLLVGGTTISVVKPAGVDHAYVVIGDIPDDGEITEGEAKTLVCVDAWPHVAKACLLSDSGYPMNEGGGNVVKGAAIGGGEGEIAKFDEKVEEQKARQKAFAQSIEGDRDARHARQNVKAGLERIEKEQPQTNFPQSLIKSEKAYEQMTIFKGHKMPTYTFT
jgi:hypothetical protein